MAIKREETGEVIKGVTIRPQRRFPWRLWMFAIVMTGAAGAAGYFLWQYREAAKAATAELDESATRTSGEVAKAKNEAAAACKRDVEVAQQHAKEIEAKLADTITQLSSTSSTLDKSKEALAQAEKRKAAIDDIQKQFAKMIDTGQLKISARRGQLVVSLPAEVLFPSGSADLSKQGEYAVVEVAGVLKKFTGRRFLVVGHTDNQEITKPKDAAACAFKDNWELSTARSLTVTHVLVTAGMDPKDVIPAGAGQHDPIAPNTTPDGRQKNRRIEIALLPAINELPPLPASLEDTSAKDAPKK
jgi:chemotaxis protein MotB